MFTCLVFLKLQYIAERKIKIEINKRQYNKVAYCAIFSQWFEDITQDIKKIYLKIHI